MGATLPEVLVEYQALWIQAIVYFFTTCIVYRRQIILSRRHAMEAPAYVPGYENWLPRHPNNQTLVQLSGFVNFTRPDNLSLLTPEQE